MESTYWLKILLREHNFSACTPKRPKQLYVSLNDNKLEEGVVSFQELGLHTAPTTRPHQQSTKLTFMVLLNRQWIRQIWAMKLRCSVLLLQKLGDKN